MYVAIFMLFFQSVRRTRMATFWVSAKWSYGNVVIPIPIQYVPDDGLYRSKHCKEINIPAVSQTVCRNFLIVFRSDIHTGKKADTLFSALEMFILMVKFSYCKSPHKYSLFVAPVQNITVQILAADSPQSALSYSNTPIHFR